MTKPSTPTHGDKLNASIDSGLITAIHSSNEATTQAAWPDLTFRPDADQSGSLLEPDQWQDAIN